LSVAPLLEPQKFDNISAETASNILDGIINSNNILDDHIAQIGCLRANNKGGGRGVLNLDKYLQRLARETRVRGRKLPVHSHARNQYNNAGVVLYTLLDRYSKVTKGPIEALPDLIECFEPFCEKFCRQVPYEPLITPPTHQLAIEFLANCGPRSIAVYNYIANRCRPDDFTIHYANYMSALQEKCLPPELLQKELDEFSFFIDFFAKRQAKPDIRHFYDTRMKASQGVSAFQKHVNALLSSYSRQTTEALLDILLPNVVIATNRSDAELGTYIGQIISDSDVLDDNNFANDFSEYDSSQYALSPMANSLFMSMFYAPNFVIDIYLSMRLKWRLNDAMVKFYGSQKMHSGEPFTLIGNTLFGMLIIARAIEYDRLTYAVFKGDDSALNGLNVRFRADALNWTTSRGLQMKDEYPPFMEFASFILTKFGFFPDVLRKSAKFLSTIFRDLTHYKQAVLNLDADLKCITSAAHVELGCIATAAYYNWLGRTDYVDPHDIYLLLGFLQNQVHVRYDQLPEYDKETFFDYYSTFT